MLLSIIFIISPLSFNYSLNRLALSQSLQYQPQYTTFDYFTITPPGKRRSIVLYEDKNKKQTIQLSKTVSFADITSYKKYKGIAAYIEIEAGGTEPRRYLLEMKFKGIDKVIGHTNSLPNKQERIASAKRLVGYSIFILIVSIIWVLYILYQYMNKKPLSIDKNNEVNHEKER